jgi:hypothetical protein
MYRLERQHLTGMAAETVIIIRHHTPVGLMTLIAMQSCHGYSLRKCSLRYFSMAGKTPITITIDPCCLLFLRQEWMTEEA